MNEVIDGRKAGNRISRHTRTFPTVRRSCFTDETNLGIMKCIVQWNSPQWSWVEGSGLSGSNVGILTETGIQLSY